MADPRDDVPTPTPTAPQLPEVDSPPADDVLDGVPSQEQIVQRAAGAREIIDEQPGVDELLGRGRPDR